MMDREKQIEEMAIIVSKSIQEWANDLPPMSCPIFVAETLYTTGYRKQSEGEWLTSDIPQEKYVCSICGGACWYYDCQGEVARSRYCPNCGAKMKGGEG